jgi:hypothetical protein
MQCQNQSKERKKKSHEKNQEVIRSQVDLARSDMSPVFVSSVLHADKSKQASHTSKGAFVGLHIHSTNAIYKLY